MYQRVAAAERREGEQGQAEELPFSQELEHDPYEPPADETEKHEAFADADEPPHPPLPREDGRSHLVAGVVAVAFICISILLYAAFFWPTLYDVSSITSGDKIYPVRINRITGNVVYFDGEQWRPTPVTPWTVPVPAAPRPATVAPAVEPAPVPAVSVTVRATPAPAAPVAAAPRPGFTPEKQPASPDRRLASSPSPDSPVQRKEKTRPVGNKRFAVQAGAFSNAEEARNLLATLRKAGMNGHVVAVPLGDRGVRHRVLIGRFATHSEASNFMQKQKLKDRYPGSFIQKLSP
jgi:cell division septation protein DedD